MSVIVHSGGSTLLPSRRAAALEVVRATPISVCHFSCFWVSLSAHVQGMFREFFGHWCRLSIHIVIHPPVDEEEEEEEEDGDFFNHFQNDIRSLICD